MSGMAKAICACLLLAALPAAAEAPHAGRIEAPPPDAAILRALQAGGYVLFMRHAQSDTAIPDRFPQVDLGDCSTQRPLTAAGRQQAAHIGQQLRRLRLPLGEVRASPYCRTGETARLAFGKPLADPGLSNTANLEAAQKAPILAQLRGLLGRPVPPGSNRILVSHSSTLADATDIFPKPEGVVVVFRPDGNGGFAHVASILPGEWDRLVDEAR